MNIEDLKMKIAKFGIPTVVKAGIVLTVFVEKDGKSIGSADVVLKIQKLVLDFAGDKYPFIEVFNNDENRLLMILKPKTHNQ